MERKKKIFQGNRMAAAGVALVVISLGVTVHIGSVPLKERDLKYQEREALLEQQYSRKLKRAEKLERQKAYMHTMRYIEEAARQKLGLVKPSEILLVLVTEE